MARKIKQVSTSITNDSFFVTALCEDNTVWTSVDWKDWERLNDIPSDSPENKEN